MDRSWDDTRSALQLLRQGDAATSVFGATKHEFIMNPCLSDREVTDFENMHGISLPPDYRSFLISVGNGGAGPAYGVFKLGHMDHGHDEEPWNDIFVGTLAKPFPHTSEWNDASGMPVFDDAWEDDPQREEQYEQEYSTWENRYWTTQNVNGAIPICHLGCARRQWLVVTGPERGNVWNDYRTDHAGLEPLLTRDRLRVTFRAWYQSWLDEALRTALG
jgi:hypothetical protein